MHAVANNTSSSKVFIYYSYFNNWCNMRHYFYQIIIMCIVKAKCVYVEGKSRSASSYYLVETVIILYSTVRLCFCHDIDYCLV